MPELAQAVAQDSVVIGVLRMARSDFSHLKNKQTSQVILMKL